MTIEESLRNAPVVDKEGYAYIIHPLTDGVPRLEPEMLREWTAWAKQQDGVADAEVILAPEAMGIPVATALSLETGLPMVVARKRSYELPGETIAYCETGYGQNCIYINDLHPGDKVLVCEDLISTGGTLQALLETLASMAVTVVGVVAVVAKGDGADRLRKAFDIPLHAMYRVQVDAGDVDVHANDP